VKVSEPALALWKRTWNQIPSYSWVREQVHLYCVSCLFVAYDHHSFSQDFLFSVCQISGTPTTPLIHGEDLGGFRMGNCQGSLLCPEGWGICIYIYLYTHIVQDTCMYINLHVSMNIHPYCRSILHDICIHTVHRYKAHVVHISNNTRDLDNRNLLDILQAFGSQKVVMDKLSWLFAVCLAEKSLGESQFHWERWPYRYALQAVFTRTYNRCHLTSKHLSIRKKGDLASMVFNFSFVSKENTCRSNICSLNHTCRPRLV